MLTVVVRIDLSIFFDDSLIPCEQIFQLIFCWSFLAATCFWGNFAGDFLHLPVSDELGLVDILWFSFGGIEGGDEEE